ncbi:hypothetical protein [Hymenobacter nivis]|uniref:Centromere protein J C-terminal domain-containing protein n=1 Tax=Hymenobacter nivis TaxID=1850093 RepID=A0A2Z3GTW3_9BACT|nr:hypothetical protein [Hymenobacter nivis]AWM34475.1 hypothetical protein DDQ68_17800 [Hymenobacter nivis]
MNTKLLGLLAVAALTTASCSQEKKTETTETTATVPADAAATQPMAVDTLAYRSSAAALAARVAADLNPADTALPTKLRPIYYTRGRVLRDIEARKDTAGVYAATKATNDQASNAVKAAVPATEYKTYTTKQSAYYVGPYTRAVAEATETKPSLGARVGQGSGIKKLENSEDEGKVKYENGAKIKRSDDGSLKIKRADGTKIKIDEDGHRTVKKPLL